MELTQWPVVEELFFVGLTEWLQGVVEELVVGLIWVVAWTQWLQGVVEKLVVVGPTQGEGLTQWLQGVVA